MQGIAIDSPQLAVHGRSKQSSRLITMYLQSKSILNTTDIRGYFFSRHFLSDLHSLSLEKQLAWYRGQYKNIQSKIGKWNVNNFRTFIRPRPQLLIPKIKTITGSK